jgi:outer membrane protein OmpA-like peptidoglycan-associated protein
MLRAALLLLLTALAGCAGGIGQTYLISFVPFSATPDSQGQATMQSLLQYAKTYPLKPITVDGFHYGQYTNQTDSLSEERVRVVIYRMTQSGIDRARIDIQGEGIAYAQGSPMDAPPPDTVRIGVGL